MQKFFDFKNISAAGMEDVNYDLPEFPVYIRRGDLTPFKNYSFKAHFHPDFEFICINRGHMNYSVNGNIIRLKENEGIFVNSNQIHYGYSPDGSDCDYVCLVVHPSAFSSNSYIERNFIFPLVSGEPYAKLNENENGFIRLILKEKECSENWPLLIMRYLFALISSDTVQNCHNKKPRVYDSYEVVKKMLDFVSLHYKSRLSLAQIAGSGGICENSCIILFRHYTGKTPVEYLNGYRISRASEMLVKTDKSIGDIAESCGFSGSSYFCEMFKKYFSVSPGAYRKKMKSDTAHIPFSHSRG